MRQVTLKKGREGPVLRKHPWIFSGAIANVQEKTGSPIADVVSSDGRWLARGLYSPKSQIRVRLLTWEREEIDPDFFLRRVSRAFALRSELLPFTNAYRLVNGEGDFLPGLVIDRYDDFLVCQFLTEGVDSLRPAVVEALTKLFPEKSFYERSEGTVREKEELPDRTGVLAGKEPPDLIRIDERETKFLADIKSGQKT
ncbi:MAG: class I SAM-dependent rRNA methyltransferase, partial [Candidatus Binatia bacterium]